MKTTRDHNPYEALLLSTSFRSFCALLGLIVVIAVFVGGPTIPLLASGQEKAKDDKPKAAPISKWEYRVMTLSASDHEAEQELNKFADDDWEVVGTGGEVTSPGRPQGSGSISTKLKVILKRPKK